MDKEMKNVVLSIILLIVSSITIKAQNLYIVSIGISDYAFINDLRYAENDVKSFNNVMKRHTKAITTLTGKNATRYKVVKSIESIFSKAQKEDRVILFFSGHGYPGGFCCYDMNPTSYQNGLSYKELQTLFKKCKSKNKLIFADACFSGGVRVENSDEISVSNIRQSNVLFFLSSRTNETSQEMVIGTNGQFTRFLVRGLGGGADYNRDRLITAKELFDFVNRGVRKATYERQHPVMWGKYDNNMVILNWN